MNKIVLTVIIFIFIFSFSNKTGLHCNEQNTPKYNTYKVLFGFFTSNKGILITSQKEEMFEKEMSLYLNKNNKEYLLSFNIFNKNAPVLSQEKIKYYKDICRTNDFDILIYGNLNIYNKNNMNIILYALDINLNKIISKKIINNSYTFDISEMVEEYTKILWNNKVNSIDMNKIYGRLLEEDVTKKNKIAKYKYNSNTIFTTSTFFLGASLIAASPSIALLALGLYTYGQSNLDNNNSSVNGETVLLYLIISAALGGPALILLLIGGIIAIAGFAYYGKLKRMNKLRSQIQKNENKIDISFSFYL